MLDKIYFFAPPQLSEGEPLPVSRLWAEGNDSIRLTFTASLNLAVEIGKKMIGHLLARDKIADGVRVDNQRHDIISKIEELHEIFRKHQGFSTAVCLIAVKMIPIGDAFKLPEYSRELIFSPYTTYLWIKLVFQQLLIAYADALSRGEGTKRVQNLIGCTDKM